VSANNDEAGDRRKGRRERVVSGKICGMSCNSHITVAAMVERDGRFLMVEEAIRGETLINQPAGHLEPRESLVEAVVRETLEETARVFEPSGLLGVYQANQPDGVWLRVAFVGQAGEVDQDRELDTGILAARFMAPAEIEQRRAAHRSPFVAACVDDYLAGRRLPLDALRYFDLKGVA